jgi:hypothetical protein
MQRRQCRFDANFTVTSFSGKMPKPILNDIQRNRNNVTGAHNIILGGLWAPGRLPDSAGGAFRGGQS